MLSSSSTFKLRGAAPNGIEVKEGIVRDMDLFYAPKNLAIILTANAKVGGRQDFNTASFHVKNSDSM